MAFLWVSCLLQVVVSIGFDLAMSGFSCAVWRTEARNLQPFVGGAPTKGWGMFGGEFSGWKSILGVGGWSWMV